MGEDQAPAAVPAFNLGECHCEHPAGSHDDGFGCTEPDCPCLAGWTFAGGDDA